MYRVPHAKSANILKMYLFGEKIKKKSKLEIKINKITLKVSKIRKSH